MTLEDSQASNETAGYWTIKEVNPSPREDYPGPIQELDGYYNWFNNFPSHISGDTLVAIVAQGRVTETRCQELCYYI